jgi:hypothetical protein
VAAFLAARGRRRLLVGALAANTSTRRFYERLGARLLGYRSIDVDGVLLDEAVYAWESGPA